MKFNRLYRQLSKKPLKVYWWRYQYPDKLNFGDEITEVLIQKLFRLKVEWAEPQKCELSGAGSIIDILQREANGNNVQVWGSGFIKEGPDNMLDNLHFTAVRGKLSLGRVSGDNIALGDPGLLLPLAFPEINPGTKKYKIGILPHYVDVGASFVKTSKSSPDVIIIDALWPVEKVAQAIASCDLVLSSSMHGLILADAFGVPNYRIKLSDKLTGGDYKFNDYYSVFDMKESHLTPKLLKDIDADKLITDYQKRPGLEKIQKSLVKAFPV